MTPRLVAMLLAVLIAACSSSSSTGAPSTTPARVASTAAVTPSPSTATTHPAPTSASTPPDLVLVNGQVVTVNDTFTLAEAVAVTDRRISAVGTSADLLSLAAPDTHVVDLGGRTVIPGFVETHTHLMQQPAPDLGAMMAGHDELIASGITTAGMPSVFPDELAAFRQLHDAGEISLRAHLYVAYNSVCGDRDLGGFYLSNEFDRDPAVRLALAGVKIFTDGGVCGGPAMSVEYLDSVPEELYNAGWTGNGDLYVSPEELASTLREVDDAGGQTVIHAIGDVAIATALSGIELAGDLDNPHQIHHLSFSSLLDDEQLAAFGRLGLTPVVQMMPWTRACEPGRTELWQSIISPEALAVVEDRRAITQANPGIRWAWHGDGPWVVGTPLQQMFSIVTAGSADGTEVCYPEAWAEIETIAVSEALRMTTIHAAAAMGFEEDFGSIEVGKAADLVILENDLFDTDPETALAWNRPVATIIDGTTAFCVGELCPSLQAHPPEAEDDVALPPAGDCVAAPASLVGWWPGEDSTDDIGGLSAGSPSGGVGYDEGVVGRAFSFDRGAVQLGSSPPINREFSMEAWVLLDADDDGVHSVFNNGRFFLRKNDATEGNGFAAFVKLLDTTVEPRAVSVGAARPGVWTHLAATWDGAELRLYLDGQLDGSATRPGDLFESAVPATIGSGEQDSSAGPWFRGRIDEFSLYDTALDPATIAGIHRSGTAGKCRPVRRAG